MNRRNQTQNIFAGHVQHHVGEISRCQQDQHVVVRLWQVLEVHVALDRELEDEMAENTIYQDEQEDTQ